MYKLSLRVKLGMGFGTLLVILTITSVASYISTQKLSELSDFASKRADARFLARSVNSIINDQKAEFRAFLLFGTEAEMTRYAENNRALAEVFSKLEPLLTTEESKRLLAELRPASDKYHAVMERAVELARADKKSAAIELILRPDSEALRAGLKKTADDLVALQDKEKQEKRREQAAAESRATILTMVLGVAGLLLGVLLAIFIARSVAGSVSRMVSMIQEVAANNLAVEDMKVGSQDELGIAAAALNSMKNNLRTIMQSIAGTAEHVASASEEISASATQTANGSETQKDQVHQIATAMQEMSSTVHEVSESCNKAADSARQTSDTARQGGIIVEDTLTHMRSIAGSVRETAQKVQELGSRSDQIGKIVGVIDDIADQTNLLALNAAIEAARAGDQGRGFAVVADEVRKLAERTTKATKEIAEMIQSVQADTRGAVEKMQSGTQQVEKGVEVTAKAGESLKQIIVQAEHVGEMVTHIATAANEQSSTTEQVNANMEQINKLVAESAQGAQQSAQACEQLSGLALELQNLVSRFRLANGTGHRQNSNRSQYRDRPARFDALPAPQPAYAGISSFSPGAARGSAAIDFSSARTKHNAWKTKLRAVLDGRLTMSESEAGSPKDCQLGKWLYSTGLSAYGHLFEMHELESTHSQMHASVREVLRAFHAGDRELAQREFQKVSELSSQVITLLTRIEQQVAADPGRAQTALALTTRPPVQHALQHSGYDRHGE